MQQIDQLVHELQALVDHELEGADLRLTLDRTIADPDAAARLAAYIGQREALTSLRDDLDLAPPAPPLARLADELRVAVRQREQVRLAVAVGGAVALMMRIGYASWPDATTDQSQANAS